MINIGVVGCTGKLGRIIINNIIDDKDIELKYAIGRRGNQFVGNDISEIIGGLPQNIIISDSIVGADNCDIFIDCTNSKNFVNSSLIQYLDMGKPVLIATTGFSEDDFIKIKALSIKVPVFFSANYSFALFNFIETLKYTVKNISEDTDIQIIELHHNQKKDAPSGTALRIQEALCEANSKLDKNKVNICSIRGGNIFGEHRVIFANCKDEIMEFTHQVSSRETFAFGVIQASKWLIRQNAGYYTMDNLLKP